MEQPQVLELKSKLCAFCTRTAALNMERHSCHIEMQLLKWNKGKGNADDITHFTSIPEKQHLHFKKEKH